MSIFEQGFLTTCQVLNQKVWNVWGFESKIPQRVIFWIKSFRKCLILIDEIQKQSEFELKTSKSVKCWKKFLSKVHVDIFVQQNGHILPLRYFQRHDFKKKQFTSYRNFHGKNRNLSVSRSKFIQRAKSWNENLTTCQFLTWKYQNVPDSELGWLQRVSSWETKYTNCQALKEKSTRRVRFWLESFTVSSVDLGFPQPVRLWTKKLTMWQILWEKSHSMSYSELQGTQRVWFWLEKSTTCQIFSQKLYKVPDFVSWNSKKVSFFVEKYKKCQILEKVVFKFQVDQFVPENWHVLPSACFFKGILLKKKQCAFCQICHEQNQNVSGSGLKVSQRVKSWNENFTTCQILTWKFLHVS